MAEPVPAERSELLNAVESVAVLAVAVADTELLLTETGEPVMVPVGADSVVGQVTCAAIFTLLTVLRTALLVAVEVERPKPWAE